MASCSLYGMKKGKGLIGLMHACLPAGAVPQPSLDADLAPPQASAEPESSGGFFGGWFGGGSKKQDEPASGSFDAEEGFTPTPQFR